MDSLIGSVISAVQVDASYDEDLETVEHTVTLPVGVSGAQTYCTRRTYNFNLSITSEELKIAKICSVPRGNACKRDKVCQIS